MCKVKCDSCIHKTVCRVKRNIDTDYYGYMGTSVNVDGCPHYLVDYAQYIEMIKTALNSVYGTKFGKLPTAEDFEGLLSYAFSNGYTFDNRNDIKELSSFLAKRLSENEVFNEKETV